MFTGIIEELAEVTRIIKEEENLIFSLRSKITNELKIDQSISHNGVCLTVVDISESKYTVIVVQETLDKTNFKNLKIGDKINIERSMKLGSRIDGHLVQGHVDQIAKCTDIKETGGSWMFYFKYSAEIGNITVEKGSVTINGVSLTVVNSQKNSFSVAIIPYTYQNTNFKQINVGDSVNIEFDVIGKYISKILSLRE